MSRSNAVACGAARVRSVLYDRYNQALAFPYAPERNYAVDSSSGEGEERVGEGAATQDND